MDLSAVVAAVAASICLMMGGLFIGGAAVLWKHDKGASTGVGVIRFTFAKGCLHLVEAGFFVWIVLRDGSSRLTLPIAFGVFIGGNAFLSRLAKRVTPTNALKASGTESEPGLNQ